MVRLAPLQSRHRGIVGPVGRAVALFLPFALAASAGSALGAAQRVPSCHAAGLTATFAVVPGSAGGGLVAYKLTLRNTSKTACRLGFAEVRLLDQRGRRLSTSVAADPKNAFGSTVVLEPGRAGAQTAHFSATFPGQGEPTKGPCEPLAYRLEIVLGQGTARLVAKVQPPTPVCSGGMLMFGAVGPAD
jgi:hypothetical protein